MRSARPTTDIADDRLYRTARWYRLRAWQLRHQPLCCMCMDGGRITKATVVDHIEPHRGSVVKFWDGPFQSLCATHHSASKQREEISGRTIGCNQDGWPVAKGGATKA